MDWMLLYWIAEIALWIILCSMGMLALGCCIGAMIRFGGRDAE